MAGNSQKLNEGELALYSMHLSSGYIPVGVDLAARVFQICYLNEKQKIKNKALSREAFLDFLKSPPFSQPLMVGFEACGGCNYWARFIEVFNKNTTNFGWIIIDIISGSISIIGIRI